MRWSPLRVDQAPPDALSLSAVREFIGLKSDQTSHNRLLDRIRTSVVADAEFHLRRAIYPQRRSFTGYVDGYYERPRRVFQLEPFRGDTEQTTVVTVAGETRDHERQHDSIALTEMWLPRRTQEIVLTYDAGFDVIPSDLLEELLAECQRRYERSTVPQGGDSREKSQLKLAMGPKLYRYRAGNEPLAADLVEVGAGW